MSSDDQTDLTAIAPDVLDWTKAYAQVDNSPTAAVKLIELMLVECPKLMTRISDAIANTNAAELKRAAHTLKGSSDIFAAQLVYEAASKLEVLGRDEDWTAVPDAFKTLDHESNRFVETLTRIIDVLRQMD